MKQEDKVSECSEIHIAADENSYKYFESVRGTAIQAFIDGTNWKKQQMMKNAVECDVRFDGLDLYTTETWGDMDELLHKINAKEGDKVKLIIIKEE